MDFQKKLALHKRIVTIGVLVLLGMLNGAFGFELPIATEYEVGGASGWTELAPGSISYDDEFQGYTLYVNDTLSFTYFSKATEKNYTLYRVSEGELANCTATEPLEAFNVTVPAAGEGFYSTALGLVIGDSGYWGIISGNETECKEGGMHLAVNVSSGPNPSNGLDNTITPTPVTPLIPAPEQGLYPPP